MMDTITSLIICFTELYTCYDFFNSLFMKKLSYKLIILLTGIIGLSHFFINSFNLTYLNMIAFPVIYFIYISLIFKNTLKERLIYLLFICTIYFGCDFLFAILLSIPTYIAGKDAFTDLSSIPWHIFTLLLLKYLVCNIFKQLSKKSRDQLDNKVYLYYLCIPLSSLGIMFLTYYAGIDFNMNPHARIILCVFFWIMQLGNIFIFHAFQKYSNELYHNVQQRFIIQEQEMRLAYFMQKQDLVNWQNDFIHDTTHYLKTIGILLSEDKTKEATSIIHNLNIELDSHSTLLYSNHSILNTILTEKKALAEKKDIEIDIYVEPGCNVSNISDIDLITMLNNLIDNAIEASIKCKDSRFVRVRIYTENQGYILVFKITNSFNGTLLKKGDKYLTTKDDEKLHGIGLHSANAAAERNNGFLECYDENNQFVAVVVLPHAKPEAKTAS